MADPVDPFAGIDDDPDDRTIIKPRPGGRVVPSAPEPEPASSSAGFAPTLESITPASGRNPLEYAAVPLLAAAGELRASLRHPDPEELRRRLSAAVRRYDDQIRQAGVSPETAAAARYVLCTFLDEAVSSTPWGGGQDAWSRQSLLLTFHNETWGGEKVFALLENCLRNPRQHQQLIELIYICMCLGFEGRYHVLADGRNQIDALRERVYQVLRDLRGEWERELSPRWQSATRSRHPLSASTPLWAVACAGVGVLLALFLGLRLHLQALADPVLENLHALGAMEIPAPDLVQTAPRRPLTVFEPPPPPPPPPPRLRHYLADQIAAGSVNVDELPDRDVVAVSGDGMFGSARADVQPELVPLLERIADGIRQVPGDVLVTGHTDSIPIANLRFSSNRELSQARAEAVMAILAERTGAPERFRAEGRAHTEPVDTNDTPGGRARNRRVEIIVTLPASIFGGYGT